MNRREFLGCLGAGVSAAAYPASLLGAPAAKRPNVVVILCDDLGYGDLGCYGHPVIKTPCLDNLASEAMKLTDCYAAAPVCSPARAGMLTGRTPYRSGIYDWIPEGSPMHLQAGEITVAKLLKSVGYATCHSGKWHCNGKFNTPDQPQPGDHGFDHWFSTQNNALPSHKNPRNFVRNGKPVGTLDGYSSTLIVDEAVKWLEGLQPGQPFCLFVWFHSPHEPVATGKRFTDMYPNTDAPERAVYYGNVTQMDHEVHRLLQTLDRRELRDDTFVMFTSDNGPETLDRYRGANHSYGSPGPLRGMKLHMYEGGIRVPGIIRFPGHTKPGQVSHEPVCGTDILPTLCQLGGAKPPTDRPIDGASITPIFTGKPIERKVPLYWQYDRAISKPKTAMRQGDWKLLADADLRTFELYNLRKDLRETTNLIDRHPDRAKAMTDTLKRLHGEIKAEGPTWPAWDRTRNRPKPAPRP
ncbi:MAG: sulfatase-like hydrolase/transferase [Phycisphaerae bacterium]|nr:sulfatase-like hydrolase/transferase [Phycisphaerae bacterium]